MAKEGKKEDKIKTRHFLKLTDFTADEVKSFVNLAIRLKERKKAGEMTKYLEGRNVALIFEKTSTRTRCAFEVACHDLGAHVTYLEGSTSQMGHKESVKDTARVLGRMYDAIEYRGYGQDVVEDLAKYAGVPVFNGLTDTSHPTQMLADAMTMKEHSGKKYKRISFAYLGDARFNMGLSLLELGAILGMDVRIGAPKALWPSEEWVAYCQKRAEESGAKILLTEDPEEAVKGVDFVHTDIWVSMGEPEEVWQERIDLLKPYRVDKALMEKSGNPDVKFMHCLPSYHNAETKVGKWVKEKFGLDGVEVTEEVFEGPWSVVFDQAENRMHTIKAILSIFVK